MLSRREWGLSTAALLAAWSGPSEADGETTSAEQAQPDGPLYFDLHIDTPGRMVSEGIGLGESLEYTHVDIPRMRQGGLHAGFFRPTFSWRRGRTMRCVRSGTGPSPSSSASRVAT